MIHALNVDRPPRSEGRQSLRWLEVATVALCALATVAIIDHVLGIMSPHTVLTEVNDRIAHYRDEDPTVLVLGSSHARTFAVFDDVARRRTNNRVRIVEIPVEWGKLSSYLWTLENRILPLLDERNGDGSLVRPSLREFVLVTEWWDATPPGEGYPPVNLPARSWEWRHFLADVLKHGITPFNRNFLLERWRRLFTFSTIVQDHGHGRIIPDVVETLHPTPPTAAELADLADRREGWSRVIDEGIDNLDSPREWEALERIFAIMTDRGINVTMLLYPRLPSLISQTALEGTLPVFKERAQRYCDRFDVQLIDWTISTPITDEHFHGDFDHITFEGNSLLANWGLDHDFGFLLDSAEDVE